MVRLPAPSPALLLALALLPVPAGAAGATAVPEPLVARAGAAAAAPAAREVTGPAQESPPEAPRSSSAAPGAPGSSSPDASPSPPPSLPPEAPWTAREAEHLLNRAAFGARTDEVEEAVRLGREAVVDRLLSGPAFPDDPFYARPLVRGLYSSMEKMDEETRRERIRERRRDDRAQLDDFLSWWVERMVDGEDPLRERMTLFWHGHFTSSFDTVRDSYAMVLQNQLYRTEGLGSFRELLHGVLRDPAMLQYLDNDTNVRESPNENLARELLELFTLGEGNYGEHDVREVARALTGWTVRSGRFRVVTSRHDDGEKTILGETGEFDGDDVVDILLRQDACARHVARRLIAWFEGVEPDEARLEEYAALLRAAGYELRPFLRALFLDPRFYRDEVVGTRVAGPVEYLVGTARRVGVRPPGRFLVIGAGLLGQRLFAPPNVKGWEGGEAWITTASLMQRANLAGMLLGVVKLDDFLADEGVGPVEAGAPLGPAALDEVEQGDDALQPGIATGMDPGMDMGMDDGMEPSTESSRARLGALRALRGLPGVGVHGRVNLSARLDRAGVSDEEAAIDLLAADLLATEVGPGTRAELRRLLADERRAAGLTRAELFAPPYAGEDVLRRVAHVLLSLPEAQLD